MIKLVLMLFFIPSLSVAQSTDTAVDMTGAAGDLQSAENTAVQQAIYSGARAAYYGSRCASRGRSCFSAAMAALETVMSWRTANQSQEAWQNWTGGYDGGDSSGIYDAQIADAQAEVDRYEAMGYVANADGSATGPNGLSLSSAELQARASLTENQIPPKVASALKAKAKAKANQLANQQTGASGGLSGLEDGQGASASTASGTNVGTQGSFGLYSSNSKGLSNGLAPLAPVEIIEDIEYQGKAGGKRIPASEAATLSKRFNGDPIGIGMANIFLIVHQKYVEKKKKKETFILREY